MSKTPWKEYETKGRKYWVHKESKETTWDMPPVLRGQSRSFGWQVRGADHAMQRSLDALPRPAASLPCRLSKLAWAAQCQVARPRSSQLRACRHVLLGL